MSEAIKNKILLIGCGYWGKNWAKTLYGLGELGAVCDPRPEIQASLKEQYPGISLYDDPLVALSDYDPEAVIIATPVVTHYEVAKACLQAHKPVLVEKPLTLTAKEAQELVWLAEDRRILLAVGHLLMYHPAILKLKSLLDAGELGEILSVQSTRMNLGKVRNEENAWWSLAPHDLSLLSLFLTEPFQPTQAQPMTLLQRPELPDAVHAQFETGTGKYGSIQVSWLSPFKRHELVVVGSEKMAVFDDTLPPEDKLKLLSYGLDCDGNQVHSVEKGIELSVEYDANIMPLTAQAEAFIQGVRTGKTLINDGRNGLQVVEILEQVQQLLDQQMERCQFHSHPQLDTVSI